MNSGKTIEPKTHNPKVTGSSPVPATSIDKASQKCEAFFNLSGTIIGGLSPNVVVF